LASFGLFKSRNFVIANILISGILSGLGAAFFYVGIGEYLSACATEETTG